jgi:tRNA(Ile)-lysidine synthetase-like protein
MKSSQQKSKAVGSEAVVIERRKIQRTTTSTYYNKLLYPIRLSLYVLLVWFAFLSTNNTATMMMLGKVLQLKIPVAYGLGVVHHHHHHHARRYSMRCRSHLALTSLSYASTSSTSTTTIQLPWWQQQYQQRRGYHHSRGEEIYRGHARWASTTSSDPGIITSSLPDRVRESLSHSILPTVLKLHYDDLNAMNQTAPATAILLVLVSGGCDSVGLLHALMAARNNEQAVSGEATATAVSYQFHVVHFDHEQRGAASDGDRELVEDLCRHYDLPLDCYYWKNHKEHNDNDVDEKPEHGKEENFSQDAARQWRRRASHELVQRLCQKATTNNDASEPTPVGIILTAHHLDDSNETLLLKVLRGAHLTNLRGMDVVVRVQHDSDDSDDIGGGHATTPVSLNQQHYSYWARPLLTTTKAEIVDYLESNKNWTWRTDASNATPKYRRNRIRNELLPLLQEVVGGEDALQRRLDQMVEQSQELHADLTSRAEAYLEQGGDAGSNLFLLPSSKMLQDVVHKQALYLWIQERSKHQFAYEHLQRVCAQLKDYPNRQQWRLNIGEGWDIVRQGETLRLAAANDEPKWDSFQTRQVDWVLADSTDNSKTIELQDTSQQSTLQVSLPREHVSGATSFVVSTVELTNDLAITPPWRKGRSPMKVSEFLRGQKVALHERKQARVICTEREGDPTTLVAVYVDTKAKWILDAKFDCEQDPTNRVPICIKLE